MKDGWDLQRSHQRTTTTRAERRAQKQAGRKRRGRLGRPGHSGGHRSPPASTVACVSRSSTLTLPAQLLNLLSSGWLCAVIPFKLALGFIRLSVLLLPSFRCIAPSHRSDCSVLHSTAAQAPLATQEVRACSFDRPHNRCGLLAASLSLSLSCSLPCSLLSQPPS